MPNPIEAYGEKLASKNAQERANALVGQITDGFLRGEETRREKDTRPFEELLTHLLPRADLHTRAMVARKLASRRDLPRRVLMLFLQDDAMIAGTVIAHSKLLLPEDVDVLIGRQDPVLRQALLKREDLSLLQKQALVLNIPSLRPQRKQEEITVEIKPLIIDIPKYVAEQAVEAPPLVAVAEAPVPAASPQIHSEKKASPQLIQGMVRAAVLRRPEDLVMQIAGAIDLSPIVTQALLKDESGEALIAACHYLGVPEDAGIQIATLLYPAITRTPQQLANLRKAYNGFSSQATQKIAEAWRALPHNRSQKHASVHLGATLPTGTSTPAPAAASEEKRVLNQ